MRLPRLRGLDLHRVNDAFTRIEQAFKQTYRKGTDIEMEPDTGVILRSPNGTRYRVVVADDGTLSTEAL